MARATILVAILFSMSIAPASALGAVDINGPWFVEEQIYFQDKPEPTFTNPCHWDATQSGTDLSVDFYCTLLQGPPAAGTLTGTIDPGTGAFTLTTENEFCTESGGIATYQGTAAADSLSFSGTVDCPGFALTTATFTGALCQNGVLDPGEACDEGIDATDDCCDDSCQPLPAGRICGGDDGDGNNCTGFTCDGAGTCTGPGPLPAGTRCGLFNGCLFPSCDGVGGCTSTSTQGDGHPCVGACYTGHGICEGAICAGAAPRPEGTLCDVDSNPCTIDACDAVGLCQPGPCSACCDDAGASCLPAYDPSCQHVVAAKGKVALRRKSGGLVWRWRKGNESDFGDPATDGATVCAYYDSTPTLFVAADARTGTCGGGPCWASSGRMTRYRDREGIPGGLKSIRLRTSDSEGAKIVARGRDVRFFDGELFDRPFPLSNPVRVQLKIADQCWESTFSTVKRSDSDRYIGVAGSPSDAFLERDGDASASALD